MSHSFRIAWKDLTELFRNRLGLVLLIVMPLFMMIMVGFIYPSNGGITDLPVAIVNEDSGFNNSTLPSQTFIMGLQQINNHLVQRGDLQGAIVIPKNFSRSILTGQQGTVLVITDNSNLQLSAQINGYSQLYIEQLSTVLAQAKVAMLNPSINQTNTLAIVKPYSLQQAGVVSGTTNVFDFVAPGIIAMTVMMSVMTGLPVAISQEKEIGTMDGMMVAPINRLSIILGKTMGQVARGLIQGVIILVLAVGLFGVVIHGNIFLVFGLLLLGIFSFVGLGIVITSFTKDQETAQMLMMTLMFPMMFLSGVFFPIQTMPWYMQDVSKFLPLTYASQALRKVMVLGADIPAISTELIILIVFGTVMTAIAVPVFRRMMTR
jgi:ABC-2 type transport system permease protein